MKQVFFFIVLCLLCSITKAQPAPDTTFYSTPDAAAIGYRKTPTQYRDETGQKYRVVYNEKTGTAYFIAHSCKRGYYRQPLSDETASAAD